MLARATCSSCAIAAGAIFLSAWNARADVPAPPAAPTTAPAPAPTNVGPVTIAAAAGPLSLEDAIKLTLTRNERAKISDLNVVVADAAVEKARAGFLPLVTIGGQDTQHAYTATNNNTGTAQAVVNQPIVNAGLFPLYSQAKALAEAQRSQNVDDKRLLSFTAATAFFQVLNAQDVVTAAQHEVENSQANLSNTQARAQSGLSSTNDVTRAQVDMSAASREVEVDKGILDNAYVQLALIANSPVPSTVVAPTATLAAARRPTEPTDTLVRAARDRRPDVQVARYQTNAAHDFADEPLLRLVPTLGVQGETQVGTALPGGRWNDETVQATLTWTLFDQGVRYADKHSRDAQADIAELNLRLLVRTVDAQVRSAAALLTAAQAAFKVADDSVKFARQNVEETAILYKQGLAKAIELIDANDSRFAAEVNYASAEFAMAQAYLGLRQALGLEPLGGELK